MVKTHNLEIFENLNKGLPHMKAAGWGEDTLVSSKRANK